MAVTMRPEAEGNRTARDPDAREAGQRCEARGPGGSRRPEARPRATGPRHDHSRATPVPPPGSASVRRAPCAAQPPEKPGRLMPAPASRAMPMAPARRPGALCDRTPSEQQPAREHPAARNDPGRRQERVGDPLHREHPGRGEAPNRPSLRGEGSTGVTRRTSGSAGSSSRTARASTLKLPLLLGALGVQRLEPSEARRGPPRSRTVRDHGTQARPGPAGDRRGAPRHRRSARGASRRSARCARRPSVAGRLSDGWTSARRDAPDGCP